MARVPDIFSRQGPQWMLPQMTVPHLLRFAANRVPLLLFLVMNSIVFYNALVHPPLAGYDAGSHLGYIVTLAEGRLPIPFDTSEFFSPPLPYALPALAYAGGLSWALTEKFAQQLNLLISLGTIFTLVRLAQLIHPGQIRYAAASLAILGLMPVYYKSFAFIRGEPWVTLFAVLIAYEVLNMILNDGAGRKLAVRSIRLGIWLGLVALARQWGFLLWIAVALFLLGLGWQRTRSRTEWRLNQVEDAVPEVVVGWPQMVQAALLISAIALVIGGWFYLHLYQRYGTAAAFNRPLQSDFSLANHPPNFYTGLGQGSLFTDPVRPSFPNQLWPKFYAEFWGDYEAYFLVFGRDMRTNRFLSGEVLEEALKANPAWLETNKEQMAAYLGRVNLIALGMTTLMLAALVYGSLFFWHWLRNKSPGRLTISYAFIWLMIVVSAAGYFAFVIMVPNPGNGDTIKATYLLHIYPFVALLTAGLMEAIRCRTKLGYGLVWLLIILTSLYLVPTFLTHYAS